MEFLIFFVSVICGIVGYSVVYHLVNFLCTHLVLGEFSQTCDLPCMIGVGIFSLLKYILPYLFAFFVMCLIVMQIHKCIERKEFKFNSVTKSIVSVGVGIALMLSYLVTGFTTKQGYNGEIVKGSYNSKYYKIPRMYDGIEKIGGYCPVFKVKKDDKIFIIDHLNRNIFPYADDIAFEGNGDTNYFLFFRIKLKDKYGMSVFNGRTCYENESFTSTKRNPENLNYDATNMIVPPIYDNIEIIKDGRKNSRIFAIIGKKNDLYDMYVETDKTKHCHYNSEDDINYKRILQNKKLIKYIGKVATKNDYGARHAKFQVDDGYTIMGIYE